MNVDLSDAESAALIRELADITGNDRYPLSARIRTLQAILAGIGRTRRVPNTPGLLIEGAYLLPIE